MVPIMYVKPLSSEPPQHMIIALLWHIQHSPLHLCLCVHSGQGLSLTLNCIHSANTVLFAHSRHSVNDFKTD